MTKYIIEPAPQASLPIRGSDKRFPVRRVYCVGRNYAAHTIEMGGDPDREVPFFFQKNPDNLLGGGADFPYPDKSSDVHHEIEMIVALQKGGSDIPLEPALDCAWGYGVALDMTRRDLQTECKVVRQVARSSASDTTEASIKAGQVLPSPKCETFCKLASRLLFIR
ncbi:MAG: fumarylacetoacetate hydrolase family protein [Gammaproteobacteria bacterium]|nr:fumarylacetoacetate hydrolase family protein [Gammaproteobacteria bacterium]MDH3536056.1 fumarylacetoacetate hydrolase family protein [Gammaproteobacteria bacterium]